jgi:hypothetical protein
MELSPNMYVDEVYKYIYKLITNLDIQGNAMNNLFVMTYKNPYWMLALNNSNIQ